VEGDRLILSRANFVPAQGDHGAGAILADHLLHERGAAQRGVLVVTRGKAKILTKDSGIMACKLIDAIAVK
jgi:hypothetical protein